jgi:hypothetical protein
MKLQDIVDTHLTDLRKTLEALAACERTLRETLRPVYEAWLAVRKEYVEKSFGCAIGDIVLDHHNQPHQVCGIEKYWDCDKPWIVGNPLKKNGEWSAVKKNGEWSAVKKTGEWSAVKRQLYSGWTPRTKP